MGLFLNISTFTFFLKYDHRGEKHRKRFKTVLVNLSFVDILLSIAAAAIRGPGFIWPSVIYGEASSLGTGTFRCTFFSVVSTWLLSDLNTFAIIPISCICVFLPSEKQLRAIIAAVWLLPFIEVVLLVIGIEQGYLNSHYTESFYKCSIHVAEGNAFNWENLVDYFNMVIFNILPLVVHISIWVSLNCKEPRMSPGKRLSGALVVATALVTWLPYGIVYGVFRYDTLGTRSLVFVFFYLSVVTNPLIYGFLMYKCGIFKEGCSSCCHEVVSDAPPGFHGPVKAEDRTSFTNIESASATMASTQQHEIV